MEQLLEDVSGKPFPMLAHELVLKPLEMDSSSFDQDLSPERRLSCSDLLDGTKSRFHAPLNGRSISRSTATNCRLRFWIMLRK